MRTEPGDKPQSRLVAQPDRPAPDTIKLGEKPQYDPIAMPDLVLFLARYGKSRAQIAAHLGFSRKVLEDWEAAHPKFAEALEIGETLALAWWEDGARSASFSAPRTLTAARG
jgi:hypothetical protein